MLLKGEYDGIKDFLKGRFGVIGDIGDTGNNSLKKELLSKILKKKPLNKQVGREEAFRQNNSMCKPCGQSSDK